MTDSLEERIAEAVVRALRARNGLGVRGNLLKHKLSRGDYVVGVVVTIPSPIVAELLAKVGFDFLWLDLEHGPASLETAQTMVAVAEGTDATPLVRVAWNDPALIKRTLDIGPHGVIVPMVSSAEEAEMAVKACKYPPQGVRGAGLSRAQRYGLELEAYLRRANREVMVVVQIEDVVGVEAAEEIAQVEGVDVMLVGPLDLSASMGVLGQMDHPMVQEALEHVAKVCREHDVVAGTLVMDPEGVNREFRRGFRFVAMGVDVAYMVNHARSLLSQVRPPAPPSPRA